MPKKKMTKNALFRRTFPGNVLPEDYYRNLTNTECARILGRSGRTLQGPGVQSGRGIRVAPEFFPLGRKLMFEDRRIFRQNMLSDRRTA